MDVITIDDNDEDGGGQEGMEEEEQEEMTEQDWNYLRWKKNSTLLYNYVLTHKLEWPSLTCEWVSTPPLPVGDSVEYRLVTGTHTDGGEMNKLLITKVRLPLEDVEVDAVKADGKEEEDIGGFTMGVSGKVSVQIEIHHEGEVNRARTMPQNDLIIATKGPNSNCYVYNIGRHPTKPKDYTCRPDLTLKGHTMEGFGLSWSLMDKGLLLSSSNDGTVCLWDINGVPQGPECTLNASHIYKSHTSVVEDVSWHPSHRYLFSSVGDDRKIIVWDTRNNQTTNAATDAHSDNINSVAFSPHSDFLFATASADLRVKVWDLRMLSTGKSLHTFTGHTDEIFTVKWSPHDGGLIASSGCDGFVNIWDMGRIGTTEDELVFRHGGHQGKVSDICWSASDDGALVSVGEDNTLQIWNVSDVLYGRGLQGEEGATVMKGTGAADAIIID